MDGVGKSGSPAPRSITSSPAALRRFASCEIAMVADVSRCCRLGDRPEPGGMRGTIAPLGKVGNRDSIPRLKPGPVRRCPEGQRPVGPTPSGWERRTHRCLSVPGIVPSLPLARPLTTEDRVTGVDAKAALERGRGVVLVGPPAPERAQQLWELVSPVPAGEGPGVGPLVLIICADDAAAAEWPAVAPAGLRVHAVTGLVRSASRLKRRPPQVLAGAVKDLAALVQRTALKLDHVASLVVAWPEALIAGEHAGALDTLLGEAREARRLVLSWNPALLADLLERHARRPLVVGALPVDESGAPLAPVGRVRYCVVPPSRRPAVVRDVLDALDAKQPMIWSGGANSAPEAQPDAVVCTALPSRDELAALVRLGEPIVFLSAAQLPYLRSIATLAPFSLPGAADRARDRAEELRERVAPVLLSDGVDAELALLDPLFERFDPAEVAGALLALQRETGSGKRDTVIAPLPPDPQAVKVFVSIGKKDRASAKDLVGALIREAGVPKDDIGRIDVRETFSLVEVAAGAADRAVRGLTGTTIRGRRVIARLDRER